MNLKIVDIINNYDEMIKITNNASKYHPRNFLNFEKRIYGYSNFFSVYLNDELIAISGIWQSKTWPKNYYRVADRTFYFPSFRQNSLSNSLNTPYKDISSSYLIPMQTEIVVKKNGFPFYSMFAHPNALQRSINLQNKNSKYKYKFINELYWTCHAKPNKLHKYCWQNVAILEKYKNINLPKYE